MFFPTLNLPRNSIQVVVLLVLAPLVCSCTAMPDPLASNEEPTPTTDRKLPATPNTRASTP